VPNWILERGLGVGRFSRVYLAQPENDPQNQIVLKYYENGEMGRRELNWLSRLVERENVPKVFASQNLDHHAFALMVTPVGKSVLPAPNNVWITPKMIVTLCGVLSYAHEKEIIHRDVKPDNIFLAGDTNTIFLNDWSSAATCGRECDYHGTPLYGEKKVERHVPTKELDLCSLVKTAFSMMKQISPPPHRHWDDIQAYWGQVSRDFPQFQILLDCARTNPPNYDQLATHFRAMW
jgi:serine/threonine protein kinase